MSFGISRIKWLAGCIALTVVGLSLVVTGCGGGSSSTGSEGRNPSSQFLKPGGKNTIPKFGQEASSEEREAAGSVVDESFKARAAADFATQCQTLSPRAIKEIPGAKDLQGCPKALKELAEPLSQSKKIRADSLSGSIAAMRVKGDRGYALYHGNDGKNYAVALGKEDGTWKVASILTIELES
jgi:hypothetical protein